MPCVTAAIDITAKAKCIPRLIMAINRKRFAFINRALGTMEIMEKKILTAKTVKIVDNTSVS